MGKVPAGGRPASPDDSAWPGTKELLHQFNLSYTKMLAALQEAWEAPIGADLVSGAVGLMRDLDSRGSALIKRKRTADGKENYGPEFLFVAHEPINDASQ
ncbi:hypothetical protein AB0D04_30475 [Streptomyces sp. NPDC048483]|uniref:hypothetical protein n=1 Tax=Streptomyces sp. NPDC048483 TaxID=3154927 RepID=UPI00343A1B01